MIANVLAPDTYRPAQAATLERGGEIPHPSLVFQDASNRQVVVAFMAFLVHIDALRSFALLNSIAVIKIGVQHCEQGVEKRVVEKLYEEPFYGCMRLSSLVEEAESLQERILHACFGDRSFFRLRTTVPAVSCLSSSPERKWKDDGPVGESVAASASWTRGEGEFCRSASAQRRAEELSAICTWMNNRQFPAWVCRSLAEGSDLRGDVRQLRVEPLVEGFVCKLSGEMKRSGTSMLLPQLLQHINVGGSRSAHAMSRTTTAAARCNEAREQGLAAQQDEHAASSSGLSMRTARTASGAAAEKCSGETWATPSGPAPPRGAGHTYTDAPSGGRVADGGGGGRSTLRKLHRRDWQNRAGGGPSAPLGGDPANQGTGASSGPAGVLLLQKQCQNLVALDLLDKHAAGRRRAAHGGAKRSAEKFGAVRSPSCPDTWGTLHRGGDLESWPSSTTASSECSPALGARSAGPVTPSLAATPTYIGASLFMPMPVSSPESSCSSSSSRPACPPVGAC